jgi:hypothetical protein
MAKKSPMIHDAAPKTGWQILAELDLLVAVDFESQVQTWMFETMYPLGIDPELLNRILKSALEAISRKKNSNCKETNLPKVRLRLYTSMEVPIRLDLKRNWGFFRIDKHGVTSTGGDHFDQLIEFFLYLDG